MDHELENELMNVKHDEIDHPSRYNQGGIEFWDVEKAFFGLDSHVDHLVQSALEYGVRFRRKNGAQDLRKGANLLNVAADLIDGNDPQKPNQVEKPHPLQNTIAPNIYNIYDAINTFTANHSGKDPTVVLVSEKVYNNLTNEVIGTEPFFGRKNNVEQNDNTTTFAGVRVVVTESIKNHQDIEVL